jgi:hypothetical protein
MNTLPLQADVDEFLKVLFPAHRYAAYYLADLTDLVIEEFGVSAEDAALRYDSTHGQTSAESTRIEQLTNWGCVHLLLAGIIKRTGPNEYQHISGPKPAYSGKRLSHKLVGEAMVSVRILKRLGWEQERIIMELPQWTDDVVEAAIRQVWAEVGS